MDKNVIRLTESELNKIVNCCVQELLDNNILYLHEGLIKSYDIDQCKEYIKRRFPNITKIVSLQNNPYDRKYKYPINGNDFVGVVLDKNNIGNYKEVSLILENLLGWFTGCIVLRTQAKGGYIEYQFNKFNEEYICQLKNGNSLFLDDFLSTSPSLQLFYLIVESKFSEVYHQRPNEIFYHATESNKVDKIKHLGLCPKSYGNFPERIYLGKDISEIYDMVEGNISQMALFQVDVSDVKLYKLYRDQRNSTAVFTYDNIPPNRIRLVKES